ncbi:DUF6529 family protein [Conexibacter sp. CPCC 206217]|uniref:DUF6529 family protein n=1 Tax=Conexibacter sp. CPCC 206217 TaxID=3064574 RepID=UPI002716DB62|nr:DUF6529 family protein [Conexibacter sp. CPCC 206217]MDO8214149.1 DUF6529 family protein [Conexibacter sp. CPCC 206217]
MEDFFQSVTRGNPTEVKVVLASVALALGCYQLLLIAVGYGKLRPGFLSGRAASFSHRAVGDALAVVLVIVALMCVTLFGFEDDATLHVVAGSALIVVLVVKVLVVRATRGSSRALPPLGFGVFALLALTWATSAGEFLGAT